MKGLWLAPVALWVAVGAAVDLGAAGSSTLGSSTLGSSTLDSSTAGSGTGAATVSDVAAADLVRGAKVTFVKTGSDATKVSVRSRLLALAVERGETPHPALAPGLFVARYEAKIVLPMRDRYRFRADGRGSLELRVNGEKVFGGTLRAGKSLETEQPIRLKKGENLLEVDFESGGFGDGSFRLLWAGPNFAFEPIAPEQLQWDAADADVQAGEQLRAGQQLFAERRCALCHEPQAQRVGESAYVELDQRGPDLRQVGARAKADWLAAWIEDPRRFRPDATMPRMHLQSAAEAHDMAAYLATLGAPLPMPAFTAEQRELGQRRFRELGCVACHVGVGDGHGDASLGERIDLSFVPQKWHPSGLVAYLQDPRRHHAHVRMPDFHLNQADATALAAMLLAGEAVALPASRGDVERGRQLVQQRDCLVCHSLDVPAAQERVTKRLGHLDAAAGCLVDEPGKAGKAPDHGLSDEQRAALRRFLPLGEAAPFRRAPLDYVARHRTAERCTACHGLDGEPSTWARWAGAASATTPLPHEQDPVAQGIPALSWLGEKLQPSWLRGFVLGEEKSPRPWLHARMPAFHQHGGTIVQGLVREHGYTQDEPRPPANAQMAIHGERLLGVGTGFGCTACHALGDQPAVQVFERAGIELFTARRRLRHEYYTRWLADPPRIDPDARMPKYADDQGKTAFGDVLGGDAQAQFEAIWQFLGSRSR